MRIDALVVAWLWVGACGSPEPQPMSPDRDSDGASEDVDCDDADPARYPGAEEVCDGIDNDCDLIVDNDPIDGIEGFEDLDGDGFGADPPVIVACGLSPALIDRGGDCDDSDPTVWPGAPELCDGVDHDCDGGIGVAGLISVGTERYTDLQAAVDAAADGETVYLCEGGFAGPISLVERELTIMGSGVRELTEISTGGVGSVLSVRGGALTLSNVSVFDGGAGPTPGGGGLSIQDAVVEISDSLFAGNQHRRGGAIYLDAGSLTVSGSTFSGNRALDVGPEIGGYGGAIHSGNGTLSVRGCTFEDNRAELAGAGIYASLGASTTISGSTFSGNVALSGGGAHLSTSVNQITDTLFEDNAADYEGGGLHLTRATSIADTVFRDNQSNAGGAISLSFDDFRFERVEWTGNTASYAGGALSVGDYATVEILDSTILENRAGTGGGGLDLNQADDTWVYSVGSDWGDGATDNQPGDVFISFGELSFSTEDFTCRTDWPNVGCGR